MKITKRQLQRIIKEEYSRLKRRGLIKEEFTEESHKNFNSTMAQFEENFKASCVAACTQIYRERCNSGSKIDR